MCHKPGSRTMGIPFLLWPNSTQTNQKRRGTVKNSFQSYFSMILETICWSFSNLRGKHQTLLFPGGLIPSCFYASYMFRYQRLNVYMVPNKSPAGLLSPSASCLLWMDFWPLPPTPLFVCRITLGTKHLLLFLCFLFSWYFSVQH